MTISPHLIFLERRPVQYISDWMLEGFLGHYVLQSSDAFYPHSYFSGAGDPLAAVSHVYQSSPPRVQTKLRKAVEGLALLLGPEAALREVRAIDSTTRLRLFSVISVLLSEVAGFDAIPRIVDSSTLGVDVWGSAENSKLAYATGLRTLVDMALTAKNHANFYKSTATTIEASLIRLICTPDFESRFAAQCAHALIEISPETFFEHYFNLIGVHLSRLHSEGPREIEHAHRTADLIAEKLPKQLMIFAKSMEIAGPTARDAWILRAWDDQRSQFLLHRASGDPSQLSLARRFDRTTRPSRTPAITLRNPSFSKYQVRSSIDSRIPLVAAGGRLFAGALKSINMLLKPPNQLNS